MKLYQLSRSYPALGEDGLDPPYSRIEKFWTEVQAMGTGGRLGAPAIGWAR